jgi:carbonic anhydrase
MAWYMRRLLVVLCAAGLTLSAVGCGKSEEEEHTAEAAHPETPAKDAHRKPAAKEAQGKPAAKAANGKGAKVDAHGHWEYTGPAGQHRWQELADANLTCVDGSAQSPIDISQTIAGSLSKVSYQYNLAPVKVKNNGHTIQVDYLPSSGFDGGKLTLNGKDYKLVQLHFHRPSEHTVNGRQFPMEVHLVHQADDQKLAVVGMLMEYGAHNTGFDIIWTAMPEKEGAAEVADKPFNASVLLPRSLATYRYAGSLTTPPCSEGVSWLLMKTPISVSQSQVAMFRKLYEFNSRYTQPLNGRDVYEDTSEP